MLGAFLLNGQALPECIVAQTFAKRMELSPIYQVLVAIRFCPCPIPIQSTIPFG